MAETIVNHGSHFRLVQLVRPVDSGTWPPLTDLHCWSWSTIGPIRFPAPPLFSYAVPMASWAITERQQEGVKARAFLGARLGVLDVRSIRIFTSGSMDYG